jgi:hypothetical protein
LLYNSFSVMTSLGTKSINLRLSAGLYILWFQSIAGIVMTLITLSRFIGLLPNVESMDDMEN